jgi:folate-binding protein YgfZ
MTEFMNTWLQFLTLQGARIDDASASQALDFGDAANKTTPATNFIAPLTDLGLIALSGEEASHFLHNQITNDVEHLAQNEARLAGYCSPKGRLLATFLMWKTGDTIMLQLPREILAAVQKRLQMFVLRSKVKLADVSDAHVALGLTGPVAAAALSEWFPVLPALPYAKIESDAGILIRVAEVAGMPRFEWITTQALAENAWLKVTEQLQPAGTHAWHLADIEAGIPQITKATQEQFVPQMVNFELIGGVNFKKGCYPGQEIVARSQYLGKLKRRMLLASVAKQEVNPGMEVFSVADREQPCGMIVNAAPRSQNEIMCLVEIKIAALNDGPIHLGSADGAELHFMALPYALQDQS